MNISYKYPVAMLVGQKIKKLRKEEGLTTLELAEEVGISQQQVSRYERGINRIDVDFLSKITQIFNISIHYFFEDLK